MDESYDSGSEAGSTPVQDEHSDEETGDFIPAGEEDNEERAASVGERAAEDLEEGEYISDGEAGQGDEENASSEGEVESEGEEDREPRDSEQEAEPEEDEGEAEGYREEDEERESEEEDRIAEEDQEERLEAEEGEVENEYQEVSENEYEEEEQVEARRSDDDEAYRRGSDEEDERDAESDAEAEPQEVAEGEDVEEGEYEPAEDYPEEGREVYGSEDEPEADEERPQAESDEEYNENAELAPVEGEYDSEAEPQEYEEDRGSEGPPSEQYEAQEYEYRETEHGEDMGESETEAPPEEEGYGELGAEDDVAETGMRYLEDEEQDYHHARQETYEPDPDMMGPESPDPERQAASDADEPYDIEAEPYIHSEDEGQQREEVDGTEAAYVDDEEVVEEVAERGEEEDYVGAGEVEQPQSPAAPPVETLDSGEESNEEEAGVGELIADIFGSSDEEDDEEFEGFEKEEIEQPVKKKRTAVVSSDEEDDEDNDADMGLEDALDQEGAAEEMEGEELAEGEQAEPGQGQQGAMAEDSDSDEGVDDDRKSKGDVVYQFDLMMERKKAENQMRRKRRRGGDIINDNDDIIVAMIKQMEEAAKEDRMLNQMRKAATKKLTMLPSVMSQLRKQDLQIAFLDCGILRVMKEWLMPLPDHSLPNLHVRESLLKVLREFPPIDQHMLKTSGIGKAVMCLYKHPKELRHCRDLAGRLINDWSRPIFGVEANFHSMSKEERQARDLAQLSAVKKRRLSSTDGSTAKPKSIETALTGEERALRPGDKGWVGRARVPLPSTKDYVVRPKWNVEKEFSKSSKKEPTKLDKHLKRFKDAKARSRNKNPRAISISIEGRKVAL